MKHAKIFFAIIHLREALLNCCQDISQLCEASFTLIATCQQTTCGSYKLCSPFAQSVAICEGCGVIPHLPVHCGSDEQRTLRGECNLGEWMGCEAMREFCDDVGGGRCDEKQICGICECNVTRNPMGFILGFVGYNGIARESLECERCNESGRSWAHHHVHRCAHFYELARDVRASVGGDGSAHAEHDGLSCKGL